MNELKWYFLFMIAVAIACVIGDYNSDNYKLEKYKATMQWKLDSTDKAERRKIDKDIEILKTKLNNEINQMK